MNHSKTELCVNLLKIKGRKKISESISKIKTCNEYQFVTLKRQVKRQKQIKIKKKNLQNIFFVNERKIRGNFYQFVTSCHCAIKTSLI